MPRINVLEYLDESAARLPEKPAFCDDSLRLAFGELDRRSRAIGTALALGGFCGEPVVVFMGKGPAAVSAFFGALRAGCFYVPLDEEMPRHRIELIFALLQPRAVIYDQSTRAALAGLDFQGEALCYDALLETPIDDIALRKIRSRAIDTDPIYVVFTSGSTGKPKGVAACHRSVIDYVENLSQVLRINEDTIFGNQAPLYVDACLKELYPTLMFGATTWFVPKQYFSFPLKLIEFLNEKRVNTVCWVASAFTMVAALRILDELRPEHLRTIAFGSEVFPVKQLKAWRKACPEARFLNLYGPTEATGMSCFYALPNDFEGDKVPIGGPFKNTDVFLLDEQNQRVEQPNTPGEICIRGTCLTLGYYADPARTAQSFTQNPLHGRYDEKIYRTGDLAQYNETGELLFLSRKDYQIKRAGYRIELGEIESAAHSVEGLHAACCLFDDAKKKIILCYAGDILRADLNEALKAKLPQYMLPNVIHQLEALPLTPNGKIDRNGLKCSMLNA
ncbi:MAG: amino acid adenylation domain-containing protein [Oscillospiraceae bacterium]|nr:amino acid adenylation domain-containing protein [Oscillospiraceae bacterium]